MSNENLGFFVIFPYLKTSNSIYMRGISLFSSHDVDHLPEKAKHHFNVLFSMFFLRDNLRIKSMTYTYIDGTDEEINVKFKKLKEVQILLSYFYCLPNHRGDTFLSMEHSATYMFRHGYCSFNSHSIEREVTINVDNTDGLHDELRMIEGYELWISSDFGSFTSILPKSRIYPPSISFFLNNYQDIYEDISHYLDIPQVWPIRQLFHGSNPSISDKEKRLFVSLDWYNRSCSEGIRIDEEILKLAIAFESLFEIEDSGGNPSSGIKQRLKETITTLLGPFPRLDSWVEQFYKARSEIVHKGVWSHLKFYTIDSTNVRSLSANKPIPSIGYRSLASYGKKIFQLCFNVISSGLFLMDKSKLSYSFFHNKERLIEINTILNNKNLIPEIKISNIKKHIIEVSNNRYDGPEHMELGHIVSTGMLILKIYLEINPDISSDMKYLMARLVDDKNSIFHKLKIAEEINILMDECKEKVFYGNQNYDIILEDFEAIRIYIEYMNNPGFLINNKVPPFQMWRDE